MPEAAENVGQGRGNHAGDAIGPPAVDGDERNHQQMRQRQPHRAELLEPGMVRIEDATRDVQDGPRRRHS